MPTAPAPGPANAATTAFTTETVDLYDEFYADKDYPAEIAHVWDLAVNAGVNPESVVDLACGTGRHLAGFAQRCTRVVGVDLTPAMVAVANGRLASIPGQHRAVVGDFATVNLDQRFDLAVCLFSSLAYCGSSKGLRDAAANIARHLRPGGVAVVEPFYGPEDWLPGRVGHDLVARDDLVLVRIARSGLDGECAVVDFHYTAATPDGVTCWEEAHRLLLAEPAAYLAAFRDAGMAAHWLADGLPTGRRDRGLVVATAPR